MTGRVVIVTGAGSGLGFHVAKTLCDDGSDVVLAGHDDEQIKVAVEKIKQLKPEAAASSIKVGQLKLNPII
jgi:NAD(P)-dependent dehydrogenase (short-subunit alcohol dehydrogenase family)